MKPDEIRQAFRSLSAEAGNDAELTRQTVERLTLPANMVPKEELKHLIFLFLAIAVPVLVALFIVQTWTVPLIGELQVEQCFEADRSFLWESPDFINHQSIFIFWFVRGTLRAFLVLLVLTFMLTAAAMPVRPSERNQGGSRCAA